jgi:hypothetical protein
MHHRQDRFHHAIDVLQYVIVPETQDSIALRLKISGSFRIADNVIRLTVLRSINFDDNTSLMAGKVSEVRTDGGLPSKV